MTGDEAPMTPSRKAATSMTYFLRGVVLVAIYLLLDFSGLRQYTSILSGTLPATGGSFIQAKCMAALYLSFYLFAWLFAPIYVISGALQVLCGVPYQRNAP